MTDGERATGATGVPGADDSVESLLTQLQDMQRLLALTRERRRRAASEAPTRLQRYVLMVIRQDGPLAVSDLAARLEVGSATVSQLVRTLEQRDWVARTMAPNDRRRHLLVLTEEGERQVREAAARQRARLRRLLERLSPTERRQLVGLVRRVAALAAADPGLFREET